MNSALLGRKCNGEKITSRHRYSYDSRFGKQGEVLKTSVASEMICGKRSEVLFSDST